MTTDLLLDLIFIALVLVGIGLLLVDRFQRRNLGDVVVTTSQGDALRGQARRGWRSLGLQSVTLLREDGVAHEISGTFEIPARHVVMVQRLPARDARAGASSRPPVKPGGNAAS